MIRYESVNPDGGVCINSTSPGIRAVHISSGISCVVDLSRSQATNRQLATERLKTILKREGIAL